jgi:hypothetical protein
VNRKQKNCLLIGIAIIVLMAIFPPTPEGCYYRPLYGGFGPNKEERMKPLDYTFHCGYTFLFTAKTSEIAFNKLFVQWAVVAVITAGLMYTLRDKKDKNLTPNQKK